MPDGKIMNISDVKQEIQIKFEELGNKGFRILGICYRDDDDKNNNNILCSPTITKSDELDMTFLGFLIFADPIKSDVTEAISNLRRLGISLKIISGDNRNVAAYGSCSSTCYTIIINTDVESSPLISTP
jgi:Mg2+-importing ATPase